MVFVTISREGLESLISCGRQHLKGVRWAITSFDQRRQHLLALLETLVIFATANLC